MRDLVPKSISSHPYYPQLLKLIRIIQFLSALISLALFSAYLARLVGTISRAHGAVEGIVAAAVAYTLIATLIVCFVKAGFVTVKVLLVLLDVAFVCGFIAVAVLTSPAGGAAGGQCRGRGSGSSNGNDKDKRSDSGGSNSRGGNCQLAKGTFTLAIVSTISHAASAWMQQSHQQPSKVENPFRGNGFMGAGGEGAAAR
ncbi:MAG: hypothetical protein M1830_002845 [Pleopsidium flavum]|nr:MAG: hypothetical protein M1830_002845 [Pleopsidium flavum]